MLRRGPGVDRIAHRHRDTRPRLDRTDPCEGDMAPGEEARDQRIFRMRRGEDHAIGLQRRDRRAQLALDMVVMRVDQFEQHAIAVLGGFQHPAEQHLVDPVAPFARLPVGDGEFAIVDRQDQIGPRPAHPLRRDRGDVAELVDTGLHPLLHCGADIGFVVDHTADGLERNARIRRNMLDRDTLAAPAHEDLRLPRTG